MSQAGLTGAPSILLAEPLALEGTLVSPEWLANYRSNLRRILVGKGFDTIDFLPEPFAVFQYYRYGARHPLVAQRLKQNVLVIDFGGGTCDVCIIETTKAGDISQSNRNSKPLAAASKPVGGFFVNRVIAEDLLMTFVDTRQHHQLKKGIDAYMKWRRGKEDVAAYAPEYRHFIRTFHSLIHTVENPKLSLCRSIRDWKLDAALDLKVPITIPGQLFSEETGTKTVYLGASRLRELFVERIWRSQLRPLIDQTLARGRTELAGAPISVVLLSGGSANIGWLKELINYDFGRQALQGTDVLPLPDYQEVVAKGLAVECARRFYNDTGDFSSVTYNRLCLLLNPDGAGCEPRPFGVQTPGLPKVQDTPGLLLPSASVLEGFIENPMRWKVRLNHPPRHQLGYFFLRSSFDPEDVKNLYNVEEQVVHTPPNSSFDARLQVELVARFGFFEGVKKTKFGSRFRGLFREAHGKIPFANVWQYEGVESFSEAEAMLVVVNGGLIMPLKPLAYWDLCARHSDVQPPGHCYFYDSASRSGKEFSYKAVGYPCSAEITSTGETGPLAELVRTLQENDGMTVTPFSGEFTQEE